MGAREEGEEPHMGSDVSTRAAPGSGVSGWPWRALRLLRSRRDSGEEKDGVRGVGQGDGGTVK